MNVYYGLLEPAEAEDGVGGVGLALVLAQDDPDAADAVFGFGRL